MKFSDWKDSSDVYGCKVVDNPIHQLSPTDAISKNILDVREGTCLGEETSMTDSLFEGWGWDRVIEEDGRLYYSCCSGLTDITDIVFFEEEWKDGVDPKEHYMNDPFHKEFYDDKKRFRNEMKLEEVV